MPIRDHVNINIDGMSHENNTNVLQVNLCQRLPADYSIAIGWSFTSLLYKYQHWTALIEIRSNHTDKSIYLSTTLTPVLLETAKARITTRTGVSHVFKNTLLLIKPNKLIASDSFHIKSYLMIIKIHPWLFEHAQFQNSRHKL